MATFSFGARYNRKKFDVDTTDLPYLSLGELYKGVSIEGEKLPYDGKGGEIFPIHAIYINNRSRFGAAPLAVTNGACVNLPRHLLDTCNEILQDAEAIEAIRAGKAGFTVYEYTDNTYGRVCYGVNFCDVNPPRPYRRKPKADAEPEKKAAKRGRKAEPDDGEDVSEGDDDMPF